MELLGSGDRSVQQLADALPICRPAVSRHLRLLKEAGLVVEEPRGTRRIYRLHDEGVEAVRTYLERVWGDAAGRFRLVAENTRATAAAPRDDRADPARLRRRLPARPRVPDVDRGHRSAGGRPITPSRRPTTSAVVLEGRIGGRIFERTPGGIEHDWGEVTVWEPPTRLGYLWHLRRDRADATDVEIRFLDRGDGSTRVEIVHSGWERLGAEAETWRDRNHGGWATLLPHFIEAAGATGLSSERRSRALSRARRSTASENGGHASSAHGPNSRSVSTTRARSTTGSTQTNVPEPPKWPNVAGLFASPIQWGRLPSCSSGPRPQSHGS